MRRGWGGRRALGQGQEGAAAGLLLRLEGLALGRRGRRGRDLGGGGQQQLLDWRRLQADVEQGGARLGVRRGRGRGRRGTRGLVV